MKSSGWNKDRIILFEGKKKQTKNCFRSDWTIWPFHIICLAEFWTNITNNSSDLIHKFKTRVMELDFKQFVRSCKKCALIPLQIELWPLSLFMWIVMDLKTWEHVKTLDGFYECLRFLWSRIHDEITWEHFLDHLLLYIFYIRIRH